MTAQARLGAKLARVLFVALTITIVWSNVGNTLVFHHDPGSLAVGAVIMAVWCVVYARLWVVCGR